MVVLLATGAAQLFQKGVFLVLAWWNNNMTIYWYIKLHPRAHRVRGNLWLAFDQHVIGQIKDVTNWRLGIWECNGGPNLMESVPFQARFFFSLYSVNTYGPFSVDKKRIGWIRIFSYLLTFQIGYPASRDFIWICHFKECEVGLHWDRRFDLHTRKEAGWLYVLATFEATIKTYKIFSSVEFAKVSYIFLHPCVFLYLYLSEVSSRSLYLSQWRPTHDVSFDRHGWSDLNI